MLGVLAVGVVVDGRDLARHHFDTCKRVSFSISHVLFAFNLRIWELSGFLLPQDPFFGLSGGRGGKRPPSRAARVFVLFERKIRLVETNRLR